MENSQYDAIELVERACDLIRNGIFDKELTSILVFLEKTGSAISEQDLINKIIDDIDFDLLNNTHNNYAVHAINREIEYQKNIEKKPSLDGVYDFNIETELDFHKLFIGDCAKSLLIIGSGYWPKTALFAQARGVVPICVDIDGGCFDSPLYTSMETIVGNAAEIDLPEADFVIVASTIGPTSAVKDKVLENIISQREKFQLLCTREPIAEERLLFCSSTPLECEMYEITRRIGSEYCKRRIYPLIRRAI